MHWCCRQLPNLVEAQKPRGQSSHGRSLAIDGDQGESSHGESYTASHHRERGAEPKPKNSTGIGADSQSWSKPDGQGPRPPEPLDGPSRPKHSSNGRIQPYYRHCNGPVSTGTNTSFSKAATCRLVPVFAQDNGLQTSFALPCLIRFRPKFWSLILDPFIFLLLLYGRESVRRPDCIPGGVGGSGSLSRVH